MGEKMDEPTFTYYTKKISLSSFRGIKPPPYISLNILINNILYILYIATYPEFMIPSF